MEGAQILVKNKFSLTCHVIMREFPNFYDKDPHSYSVLVRGPHVEDYNKSIYLTPNLICNFIVKIKQSRYRPGVAQRVPGS